MIYLHAEGGGKIPIKIGGQRLNVDVRSELERYEWTSARWTDTKLIAASPFRYDKHPSFFVNLDEHSEFYGCWTDSGAVDSFWGSGGLVKLLSFLRDETYEETIDYLTLMYSIDFNETTVKLPPIKLKVRNRQKPLDNVLLKQYLYRHPYLGKRGIGEPVQRLMGVGYDRQRKAITMPWRLPDGSLANIKYRRVDSKIFWYEKGGLPVQNLVYGIDIIYRKRLDYAVLCEAEIDAMSFMVCAVPAIAVGGSVLTEQRAEMIRRSPLQTLYIATDNDKTGGKLRRDIWRKLGGYLTLYDITISTHKDANEALMTGVGLKYLVEESRKITLDSKTLVRL